MTRKDFLQLTGLGAAGLLFAPAASAAAWREDTEAKELVDRAVAYLQSQGATYADARMGLCLHTCNGDGKATEEDALGIRYHTTAGWRQALLMEVDRDNLEQRIDATMSANAGDQTRNTWCAAHFERSKLLASKSSDSTLGSQLEPVSLRWAQRAKLPVQASHIRFCDFILQD